MTTTTPRPTPTRHELEASLEAWFRKAVRVAGGSAHKLAPTEKGMPDRLVLMPGGRMYLVELKTEVGTVKPAQTLWHMKAAQKGIIVVVLAGRAGVAAWLRSLFNESDQAAGITRRLKRDA